MNSFYTYSKVTVTRALFCAVLFFLLAPTAFAQPIPLRGYMWSDTIGWIDLKPIQSGYGVSKQENGDLLGYAWSENIGIVKFGGLPIASIPKENGVDGTVKVNARVGAGNIVEGWARAISPVGIPEGLIAYWAFNEESGTSATDSSGHHKTGTLTNNPTRVNDRLERALSFDGVNDYVNFGDTADIGDGAVTVSAWIKGDPSMSAWGRILDKGFSSAYSVTRYIGTNDVSLEMSGVHTIITSAIDNTWHHILFTRSGQTVTGYKDGVQVVQVTNAVYGQNRTNALPFFIGYNPGEGTRVYWKGIIDDVRIYDRALTSTEVNILYTFTGNAGGWDGWISLKGTTGGGGSYGGEMIGNRFFGWGWGSDVVEWLHYRGGIGLAAGSCSPPSIFANWNRDDSATGYKLYRNAGGTEISFDVPQPASGNIVTYEDTSNLRAGALYLYRVASLVGGLEGPVSSLTTGRAPTCANLKIYRVDENLNNISGTQARYDGGTFATSTGPGGNPLIGELVHVGMHTVDATKLTGKTITVGTCTYDNAAPSQNCEVLHTESCNDSTLPCIDPSPSCTDGYDCVRLSGIQTTSGSTTKVSFLYSSTIATTPACFLRVKGPSDGRYTTTPEPVASGESVLLQTQVRNVSGCTLNSVPSLPLTRTTISAETQGTLRPETTTEGPLTDLGGYTFNLNCLDLSSPPAPIMCPSVTVPVDEIPIGLSCSFIPPNSTSEPVVGRPLTIQVSIVDGVPPFNIHWTDSDNFDYTTTGPTQGIYEVTRIYSRVGSKSLWVDVIDSEGNTDRCSLVAGVNGPNLKVKPLFDVY